MLTNQRAIIQLIILNVLIAGAGFGKDILLAAYLGTGAAAASFSVAYYLPDTLGNGMIGSALLIATTTVFSSLQRNYPTKEMNRFACRLLWVVGGSALALSLFTLFFAGPIMRVLVGQVSYLSMAEDLLVILIPLLFIYPLQYVLSGFLQSYRRFLLSSATPVLVSLAAGAATVVLMVRNVPAPQGVFTVAALLSLIVFLYVLVLWGYWRQVMKRERAGVHREATVHAGHQVYSRQLLSTFGWFLLYLAFTQMIGFVERGVAARMEVAMLAGLNYAYRVAQVPLWIFVSAVTTWILPSLSKSLAAGDYLTARRTLTSGIKLSMLSAIPAEIIFVTLANPIVNVLFARGAFTASSVLITAGILKGYALAIVPLAVSVVLFRYFAADMKMGQAVLGAFAGAVVNIGFDVLFARRIGPMGLGIGSAIGNGLNMTMLIFILLRSGRWHGLSLRSGARYLTKLLIPALFTTLASAGVLALWEGRLSRQPFLDRAGWLLVTLAVWGIGYLALLFKARLVKFARGKVTMT